MAYLGVPPQGEEIDFPLYHEDRRALRHAVEGAALRRGAYACIHPGARLQSRRWPTDRFAAVADALAAHGLQVVLTGSATEAPLDRERHRVLARR